MPRSNDQRKNELSEHSPRTALVEAAVKIGTGSADMRAQIEGTGKYRDNGPWTDRHLIKFLREHGAFRERS